MNSDNLGGIFYFFGLCNDIGLGSTSTDEPPGPWTSCFLKVFINLKDCQKLHLFIFDYFFYRYSNIAYNGNYRHCVVQMMPEFEKKPLTVLTG